MICVLEMNGKTVTRIERIQTIREWFFNIRVALFCRLGRALPPFLVPILNPFFADYSRPRSLFMTGFLSNS